MNWYPAPGKLNLCLHVLGRRQDGYHELQTVFRLVERSDRVRVAVKDDGRIRFSGPFGDENLCATAAAALKAESGISSLGCELALEKTLPVGGGMGGGSSDAATVLLVLNRLWNLRLKGAELRRIGLRLGADVPFFLYGTNALGEGIGERLSALELPAAWYLVLHPQVSVSTKEIFSSALTPPGKPLKIPPFFRGLGRNDLEAAACARYPEIKAHLDWLRQRLPAARMTGSGACVFAELGSEAEARAIQAELPTAMHGFVAQGLDRHPLYDWMD